MIEPSLELQILWLVWSRKTLYVPLSVAQILEALALDPRSEDTVRRTLKTMHADKKILITGEQRSSAEAVTVQLITPEGLAFATDGSALLELHVYAPNFVALCQRVNDFKDEAADLLRAGVAQLTFKSVSEEMFALCKDEIVQRIRLAARLVVAAINNGTIVSAHDAKAALGACLRHRGGLHYRNEDVAIALFSAFSKERIDKYSDRAKRMLEEINIVSEDAQQHAMADNVEAIRMKQSRATMTSGSHNIQVLTGQYAQASLNVAPGAAELIPLIQGLLERSNPQDRIAIEAAQDALGELRSGQPLSRRVAGALMSACVFIQTLGESHPAYEVVRSLAAMLNQTIPHWNL